MMDLEFLKLEWQKALASSTYFNPYYNKKTITTEEMAYFWDSMSKGYDDTWAQDERRVKKVLDILKNGNYIDEGSSALEIGSGTGIHTIPLSKYVKEVVTIDASTKMIEVLKEKANKAGAENIVSLNENWNELNLKEKGLHKKFDLVLSSFNPSIKDFDSLNKMNEASKGVCCLASWAGSGENKVASELNSIIWGEKHNGQPQRSALDIIYSFSIIYSLGYFPKLDYVDSCYTIENSYDEAVDRLYKKYCPYDDRTIQTKDKISKYVKENMIDGVFRESFKTKIGIITWKVKNI